MSELSAWLRRLLPVRVAARKRLGNQGERIAAAYLASKGYRIIDRNVRVSMGEADIVVVDPDGQTHVVVEVKTRTRAEGQHPRSAATAPEESVTAAKEETLRQILQHLARANHWSRSRIDVVAVEMIDGQAVVRHHEGTPNAT